METGTLSGKLLLDDLVVIEKKIERLIGLYQALSSENQSLKERIAHLEVENKCLSEKIEVACNRLETLMALVERLPE
jgi:cell division protein ZapB